MKRYYDVYVIPLIKYYHYALTNVNILFPLFQGLGTFPKMKTGRFGGQPERSVFPVWVLTGFACCSARKSRSTHAVFRKCSYTCCACSSSHNRIDSNICSCYNWNKRLKKALECSYFSLANGGIAALITCLRSRASLSRTRSEAKPIP